MHEETLFAEALGKKGRARAAFLDEQCKGDVEVRQRLEALLRAHDNPDPFLVAPAPFAGATLDLPMREGPGTVIGPFKLLQQIGEGGMGTVFMAEQTQPVQRKVALKIIKAGMDSRQVVARFEAERQALALMDHPNIAKVLDAGATESGRPYFVMELVRGLPITRYCDEHHLTLRQRLELFVPVCQAVQHAHQKGIIHRDLKPSNVMVCLYDDKPVPKVIDFGVAKATGPRLTDRTRFTEFGQVVGTLEYMSPEQAELNQLDSDTRSDIYSLGVLLYELLTGTTPLQPKRLKSAGFLEALRLIREGDTPRPSSRLSTLEELPAVAANRGLAPKQLSGLVRAELDWIVMKCLEKDRNRRYETAYALAQDIERYLNGEPVGACPPSAAYRLRKFVQRNKGPVVAATLVVLALVAGVIGVSLSLIEARHQEQIALTAAEDEKKARWDEAEQRRRTADALVQVTAEQNKTKLALAAEISARKQTREALNALTDDVIGQVFGKQPQLGESEKDFLRRVLAFYQAFAAEQGESEEARWVAADGQYRVARLRAFLGEKTEAVVGYREAIRRLEALVPLFPGRPAHRQLLALGHNNLGILLRELGEWSAAEMHYREALTIWKLFAADFPSALAAFRADVASCRHNLSVLLSDLGKRSEAETVLREALAIQEKLVEEFPNVHGHRQDLALSYNNLGSLLGEFGKLAAAEAAFTKALILRQRLADRFPDVPIYRQDLAAAYHSQGSVLHQLGKRVEANKRYRQTLTIQDKLVGEFPTVPGYRHDLATTYDSLGRLLRDVSSKRADAETAYRRALAIRHKLVDDFAGVPAYRQDLAASHARLGSLLGESGKQADGEAAIREALAIQTKLVADFPDVPLHRKNLADSHSSLGHLLSEWRKWTGADHAHHQALGILEKLADKFPDVPAYRRGLALSHNNLGIVLHRQGKLPEAEAAYRKALAIQEKLAGDLADMPSYRMLFAASSVNFGHLVRDQGRPQDALAWYAKAIPLLETNLVEDARLTRDRLFLRNAHWERAQALTALKRDAEALKDWDRVVALEEALEGPAESWFRLERALTRARLGDHAQAVAEAEQLTLADKTTGGMLYNAACVHGVSMRAVKDDRSLQEKYAKQAIALLRRAHAAGYFRNAKVIEHLHLDDDLTALRDRADFKELVTDLKGNQEKK